MSAKDVTAAVSPDQIEFPILAAKLTTIELDLAAMRRDLVAVTVMLAAIDERLAVVEGE